MEYVRRSRSPQPHSSWGCHRSSITEGDRLDRNELTLFGSLEGHVPSGKTAFEGSGTLLVVRPAVVILCPASR